MFDIKDLDRRRIIFDRWTSAAGDMLDFREKWTERNWKDFARRTGEAMEEVLRVRPDLNTMPLAELFDIQSAKLRTSAELVNTVMRSMAVLETAMATAGRKDMPIGNATKESGAATAPAAAIDQVSAPENAIECNQAQMGKVLNRAIKAGIAKTWGTIYCSYFEPLGHGKYLAVFRDAKRQDKLRQIVQEDAEKRKRKPKVD
jgi:hypothetical protein